MQQQWPIIPNLIEIPRLSTSPCRKCYVRVVSPQVFYDVRYTLWRNPVEAQFSMISWVPGKYELTSRRLRYRLR